MMTVSIIEDSDIVCNAIQHPNAVWIHTNLGTMSIDEAHRNLLWGDVQFDFIDASDKAHCLVEDMNISHIFQLENESKNMA